MYSVGALPTVLTFDNGSVQDKVSGAYPSAITAAVEKAVKLAGNSAGPAFASGGQRLGGSGVAPARSQYVRRPIAWYLEKWLDALLTFFGLYFVSLFSVSGSCRGECDYARFR